MDVRLYRYQVVDNVDWAKNCIVIGDIVRKDNNGVELLCSGYSSLLPKFL